MSPSKALVESEFEFVCMQLVGTTLGSSGLCIVLVHSEILIHI